MGLRKFLWGPHDLISQFMCTVLKYNHQRFGDWICVSVRKSCVNKVIKLYTAQFKASIIYLV